MQRRIIRVRDRRIRLGEPVGSLDFLKCIPFGADVKLVADAPRCHMGNSIIYDTVTKWNWSVDVRTHPIKVVIDKLLEVDWNDPLGNGSVVSNGTAVPVGKPEAECVVRVFHFSNSECLSKKEIHSGVLQLGVWQVS